MEIYTFVQKYFKFCGVKDERNIILNKNNVYINKNMFFTLFNIFIVLLIATYLFSS